MWVWFGKTWLDKPLLPLESLRVERLSQSFVSGAELILYGSCKELRGVYGWFIEPLLYICRLGACRLLICSILIMVRCSKVFPSYAVSIGEVKYQLLELSGREGLARKKVDIAFFFAPTLSDSCCVEGGGEGLSCRRKASSSPAHTC